MDRAQVRMAVAGVGAAVVLLASGCGVQAGDTASSRTGSVRVSAGSFDGARGSATLRQAAAATGKVRSMRLEMDVKTEGGPMEIGYTAKGEADNVAKKFHLTMDMGAMLGGASGGGAGMGTIEEVVDGTTIYMKSPIFSRLGGSGKPWVKVDAKAIAGKAGVPGGTGSTGAASDPTGFVAFLEGAGSKVTTIGTDTLRGVKTTHVRTTIDLEQLLKKTSGARRERIQKQLDSLGAKGIKAPKLPTDAWVDADGYLRKLTMTFDVGSMVGSTSGASASMSDMKMVLSMELYDFNEPVTIVVPPASQVGTLDLSALGGD